MIACHSWLRVPVTVPRHSWLGGPLVAVLGGPLPLLAVGLGGGSRPLLAGVCRPRRWVFPRPGVSRVVCACAAACAFVVPVLVCVVWCVFLVSVLVVVWALAGLPRVFVCVCVCVRVWCIGGVQCGAVWCVVGGVAGVWCGWSLATPGGGSCVLLPATPGWVSLPPVVGVPCHSWLRVSGVDPRYSWLGSAGRGGGCFRGWGFPVLCVLVSRRVCLWCLCWCVWCVFVVSVLVVVWAWACLPRVFVCVRVCACVVCWWRAVWCGVMCWWGYGWFVLWLVPRHSWRRFLCATRRHSWLVFAAGGGGRSSPLLAEGPGCGSPPLLAGVRRR